MQRIKISRVFPRYHARAGQPTYFRDKILNAIDPMGRYREIKSEQENEPRYKLHTIRAGRRFNAGDFVILDEWRGLPYRSHPEIIVSDLLIVKTIPITISANGSNLLVTYPFEEYGSHPIWENDGLTYEDFRSWFADNPKYKEAFVGQIICFQDPIADELFYERVKKIHAEPQEAL